MTTKDIATALVPMEKVLLHCNENGIDAIDGPRLADFIRRLGLSV